jgi:glycosyltransferase involved in cell wall biosynthesis
VGKEDRSEIFVKVLMCITGLNRGGAEKNFTEICLNTAANGFSFEPCVASLIGGHYLAAIRQCNIPAFVFLERRSLVLLLRTVFRFAMFLLKNRTKIDLVEAYMPHGGLLGAICSVVLCKPFVYSVRNSQMHDAFRNSPITRPVRDFCHEVSLRLSTAVTCNSPSVKLDLEKRMHKEIHLVLNAIEIPAGQAYKDAAIKEAYFPNSTFYNVVTVCNMRYPQKDIVTLLRVAKVCPELRFVLVGDGSGLGFFKEKAKEFGTSNVTFAGAHQNVYPFLSHADVYVLLTHFEGFPNSVLEAMISKTPVIVSDIPEVRDFFIHCENCLLVKNGDIPGIAQAIGSLKSDKRMRDKIVSNAFEMASTVFAPQHMIASNYVACVKAIGK